jgi:hypothetical protein
VGGLRLEWKGWVITDVPAEHGIFYCHSKVFSLYDSTRTVKKFYEQFLFLTVLVVVLDFLERYLHRSVLTECKCHNY